MHSGDWQGSDHATHTPRWAAISEILANFEANKSVLDVGCGEATLRAWLPEDARYVGVERSAAAMQVALQHNPSASIFQTAAESFDWHGERFDSVVFNEMLYYTNDPRGLLKKYVKLLRKRGVFLCSIYQRPETFSWKKWLLHCFDRRRPISNIHCERMVRSFMMQEGWPILEDRSVAVPGNQSLCWHIWLAMPASARTNVMWTNRYEGVLDDGTAA